MTDEDSQPELQSKLNNINTHVSRIERAFGGKDDDAVQAGRSKEEFKQKVISDREMFIKLYQPAAMNYARGVLLKLAKQWDIQVDIDQDVPAVWANLVVRLLDGKFTSFNHKGVEGSFRKWLRRVLANECKNHLKGEARVLGKKGPRNPAPLNAEIDPEVFDPEDDTLETTIHGTLIKNVARTMREAGLHGDAVLFWQKRVSEIEAESNITDADIEFAMETNDGESPGSEQPNKADEKVTVLSQELAEYLSEISSKQINIRYARKILERGRDLFAENFITHVARLDGMFDGGYDADRIEETLIELKFLGKQKTERKGVNDTQFSRRLRKLLNSMRNQS